MTLVFGERDFYARDPRIDGLYPINERSRGFRKEVPMDSLG